MNNGKRIQKALQTKTPIGVDIIRLGNLHDGGYIIVDDISSNDYLISMGILDDVSFEQSLSSKVSHIDMYDYSIDDLPDAVNNSSFFKEKIGPDSHHILDKIPAGLDAILKIDIEGSEWDFFDSLSEDQIKKFRQIAVEIHWMIDDGEIYVEECPIEIIEKINQTHQLIVVHPNNNADCVVIDDIVVPKVIELTFLRKKDYIFKNEEHKPTNLFHDNNILKPSIESFL